MLSIKTIMLALSIMLLYSVSSAKENYSFEVYNEIRVSSIDMNCNYVHEDFGKYRYAFEYPKLIITENGDKIIAFIDEKSKKLMFANILDRGIKTFDIFPKASGDGYWLKWPIIFSQDNKIYVAAIPGSRALSEENARIKVYLFNRDNKKLHLYTDKQLNINKPCIIYSIFAHQDKFVLAGKCNYICWRYLPHMFTTTNFPVFEHNVSFLLDEKDPLEKQPIEEEGCFTALKDDYAVSKSGMIYSVWVRDTHAVESVFDQMIYYSVSKDGIKWETPIELYSLNNTKCFLELINVSLASSGYSAFLLWQDFEKGIYLAELKDEKKYEITKISDIKKQVKYGADSAPDWRASTLKVASDARDNVYALWTQNRDSSYQLFFKARINGQWSKALIINEGAGNLKLPDMKIDKEGKVHITYIKSMENDSQSNLNYGEYGCYYMKLERKY